jgi:hypothetical protein
MRKRQIASAPMKLEWVLPTSFSSDVEKIRPLRIARAFSYVKNDWLKPLFFP